MIPSRIRRCPAHFLLCVLTAAIASLLAACSSHYERRCGDADFGHIYDPISGWGASDVVSFPRVALDRPGVHSFAASHLPRPRLPKHLVVFLSEKPSQKSRESLKSLGENLTVDIRILNAEKTVVFETRLHAASFVRNSYDKDGLTYAAEIFPEGTPVPELKSYTVELRIVRPLARPRGKAVLSGSYFW